MKTNTTYILGLLALAFLSACGGGQKASSEETAAESTDATETSYTVNNEASSVKWRGEVAGVYGHEGLIAVKEGQITAKGNQLTGGTVVIDMKTIAPTDSASYKDEEGRRASDLVGHLSTGDFFLVEEFPTASFTIKSQNGNDLVGDLTIRGITKEVTAKVTSLETTDSSLKGSADLTFNRQDFKVSWVHFMKDMILSDDIKISLDIQAKS